METKKMTSQKQCYGYTLLWLVLMIVFAYLAVLVHLLDSFETFLSKYNEMQNNWLGVVANISFLVFVCWDYYLMCNNTLPKSFYVISVIEVILLWLIWKFAGLTSDIYIGSWHVPCYTGLIIHGIFLLIIGYIKSETLIYTNGVNKN